MGPYWAIGCLIQAYRIVAMIGIAAAFALIPPTYGASLLLIPAVFAFILAAQLFQLLVDIAKSARGMYSLMKQQNPTPPDPAGTWESRPVTDDYRRLRERAQRKQRNMFED